MVKQKAWQLRLEAKQDANDGNTGWVCGLWVGTENMGNAKWWKSFFFQHTIVEDLPYEHKSFLFIKALSETVFMHELHLKWVIFHDSGTITIKIGVYLIYFRSAWCLVMWKLTSGNRHDHQCKSGSYIFWFCSSTVSCTFHCDGGPADFPRAGLAVAKGRYTKSGGLICWNQ